MGFSTEDHPDVVYVASNSPLINTPRIRIVCPPSSDGQKTEQAQQASPRPARMRDEERLVAQGAEERAGAEEAP